MPDPDDLPHRIDMVHDLRQALGQEVVAMDAPPKEVWERALADAAAAMGLAQRLVAVCESYGLPPSVDALVRHIAGNSGMKSYVDAQFDQVTKLTHVGFWSPEHGFNPTLDGIGGIDVEGAPAFLHSDWPMLPPIIPEGDLPTDDAVPELGDGPDDEDIVRG